MDRIVLDACPLLHAKVVILIFFFIAQGQAENKNFTAELCPGQVTLHNGTLLFCANEVPHNVTANCQQKKKHNENIYRTYYYSRDVLKIRIFMRNHLFIQVALSIHQ